MRKDNRLGPTIPGKNRVVYFTVRQSGEATVWQYSRFDGDIRYWKHQLGHIEIEEKKVRKHGKMETSLQFQLTTDVHFAKWEELFITP